MRKLSEIFECWYGVNLELINCQLSEDGIPFVSRTGNNNGVVARVSPIPDIEPNPPHTLSLACGGSVLSCFYQDEEYYSGRDLFILSPKKPMTKNEMLLYSYIIGENKYKYNYGRQANKTFQDLMLPELSELSGLKYEVVNANFKFNERPVRYDMLLLHTVDWDWFATKDIFKIEKCKCSNATELLEIGNDIVYIGAKKSENGVMRYAKYDETLVTKGNCIVFIGDGQGSVGYCLYQHKDFIGSTTLVAGYNEHLNPYTALFLVTILDMERYRYSFGRKYNKNAILNSKIKLPVDSNGNPDWQFMENYIKSLPYSANL